MPTIDQLPSQASASPTDVIPISSRGITGRVTVGSLLAGMATPVGVWVRSLAISSSSHLIATLTDGTIADIGAVGGSSSTGGGGTTSPTSQGFTRAAYAASGAISPAATLAILTGASGTQAMTLANGTADGQPILVKLMGQASATLTAVIDGASQSVAMTASPSGTIKDTLKLRWSASDTSWLAE